MRTLKILLSTVLCISSVDAYAACTTPVADAGGAFYNTTVNAVQFCDGTSWYNTGLVAPSATGTACTNPVSPEGGAYYNTTQNTIQFCNGDNWVNMGTMKFPSATGTACTTPTSPEGGMFYNTTVSKMQFCNGDDWVNATYMSAAIAAIAVIDGTEMNKQQASDKEASDYFGYSSSIDGDYAIVGAYGEDTGGASAGAAYIFKRTGASWAQEAKIQATDKQAGDSFGLTVSLSGDYAIVGSYSEDTGGADAGAAYIFKRTGASWAQEAKIQAADKQAGDFFGTSVSIDGDYALVGARTEDTGGSDVGAAYIFKRTGTSWGQEAKIQASDKQASDSFGSSSSISGDYAIVGAYFENTGGSRAGAAYVFKRTGASWAEEARIQASDKEANDLFGASISLDGDYAVVGAYSEDTGGADAGAVYVFKRTGTTWTEEAKIQASDKESADSFGSWVSISGDYIVVGAYGEDTGAAGAGAAYVFKRTGTTWAEELKIQASDKQASDAFGISVATDDGKIVVGAYAEATGGANAGAVYFFD
jgi:hypothetical protein